MMNREIIINSEESFDNTVQFFKKYFKNVRVVKNEHSDFASISQNYHIIILFENRNDTFSIKWNYFNCTLFMGDITKTKKTSFQYSFTKIRLDICHPIEESNNYNVVFWMYELVHIHDDMSYEISPLRLPMTLNPELLKQ